MAFGFLNLLSMIRRSGETHLANWADKNGLVILAFERRWLGIFSWITTNTASQKIYYVAVGDPKDENKVRLAWIRCGHWLWGLDVENVEVRWDGPWRRFSEQERMASLENPMADHEIDG